MSQPNRTLPAQLIVRTTPEERDEIHAAAAELEAEVLEEVNGKGGGHYLVMLHRRRTAARKKSEESSGNP